MAPRSSLPSPAPPRARRPTAHDVAQLAGVSQSAVSRAFTAGASISAEARGKIMEAARQLGYRPNLIARSLITQRTGTIGVAMGYMENQFYPAILERLSEAFGAAGYRVLLFTPGPDGNPDPILDEVLRYQVEAVVLASARLTSHFASECAQARVPVVLLNRRTEDEGVSSVTGQNRIGARTVAAFLATGGHRRLAFVAGLEDSSTSLEREQGFTEGLQQFGVAPPLRGVGHYDFEASCRAARALLSRPDRPDGIFCANDHTAFAVMQTARAEFGLVVGRDVSVVGFDDVPLASWPAFDLTTYSQPVGLMAERVVAVTLQHLSERNCGAVREVVPGTLMVRGSARIPAGG
jgi:DNA-binding LacI/PurR family transcriptional regulator